MKTLILSGGSATIDVIALAFVLIFALWGLFRGFTKTFFSLFGTILALLFAVLLAPSVASFLQEEFGLVTKLGITISDSMKQFFGEDIMNATLMQVTEGLLKDVGVAGFIISIILSFKKDSSFPQDTKISEIIGPTFAYYLLTIIAVIVLFIIFKIIFFFVGEIIKKSYENKTIARFDRTLGCALGLINGIINLELIIMVISMIPTPWFQGIYADIQASGFARIIESINLYGILMRSISVDKIISSVKLII